MLHLILTGHFVSYCVWYMLSVLFCPALAWCALLLYFVHTFSFILSVSATLKFFFLPFLLKMCSFSFVLSSVLLLWLVFIFCSIYYAILTFCCVSSGYTIFLTFCFVLCWYFTLCPDFNIILYSSQWEIKVALLSHTLKHNQNLNCK